MRKKETISDTAATGGKLRPEYRFDYRKAKPNRFAADAVKGGFVVLVDEDIAQSVSNARVHQGRAASPDRNHAPKEEA